MAGSDAIEEFEQPTFHIMVYASYPEYVARLVQRDRTPKLASGKPLPDSEQQ